MYQISVPQEPFDTVVVGIVRQGWRVALLEAGPKVSPKDFSEHTQPWQLSYLGQSPAIKRDRPIQTVCRITNGS